MYLNFAVVICRKVYHTYKKHVCLIFLRCPVLMARAATFQVRTASIKSWLFDTYCLAFNAEIVTLEEVSQTGLPDVSILRLGRLLCQVYLSGPFDWGRKLVTWTSGLGRHSMFTQI